MPWSYPEDLIVQLERSRSAMRREHRVWDLCHLYYEGKQHLRFDRTDRRFVLDPTSTRNNQVTVNRILPLINTRINSSGVAFPMVGVNPSTGNAEDLTKAISSRYGLKHAWDTNKMDRILRLYHRHLFKVGNGILFEWWCKKHKMTKTRCVSPYDYYLEEHALNKEESAFQAVRSFVLKRALKEAYPKDSDGKSTSAAIDEIADAQREEFGWRGKEMPRGRVEVWEVYWPNGKYAVVCKDLWLFKGEMPDGIVPIQHQGLYHRETRPMAMGMIEPIIDPQNQYNDIRAQILLNARLSGNPLWLVPVQSKMTKPRAGPGARAYYNPAGGRPEVVKMPELPHFVNEQPAVLNGEMQDITIVHNTAQGKRTIGVTSGKAMEFLDRKDDISTGGLDEDLREVLTEWGRCQLVLMKAYYTKQIWVRLSDGAGSVIHRNFKATDFVERPEVVIEPDTIYREDRRRREARILEKVQIGIIPPEKALELIDADTPVGTQLKQMMYLSHALDILDAVKNGLDVEVFPSDDLPSLVRVFDEFIKEYPEEYYLLSQDIQDTIRDLLVAMQTWGQPGAFEAAAGQRVWPQQQMAMAPQQAGPAPSSRAPMTSPEEQQAGADMLAQSPTNMGQEAV